MISVIIPARNEFLLKKTIESTLESARGDIEIIAVLDGYWPEPPIIDDKRVTLIHHTEPVGQRAAVNEAANIARGKYILKTDGHSMFDEGFDIKLAEDCEYDWTVIPRMYNLHAFDYVCPVRSDEHRYYQDKFDPHKENMCPVCGPPHRMEINYVWKPRLNKRTDFMFFNKELRVKYWHAYEKRPEAKGDIVDIMNGIGACWFQHKDRFFELGGLDENHGSWGQVGVEVACKAWLSGGRHVVNKKTWFAHMFRTTGPFGFPYKIHASDQDAARKYSYDLWTNNNWPLAKKKFDWLIEKFSPVPTWNGQIVKEDNMKFQETENKKQIVDDFHKLFWNAWNRKVEDLGRTWQGVKIVKYPTDLMIYQQLIYKNKPDVIIEVGSYLGGSALFFANMLDLIGKGMVIAIDKRNLRRRNHSRINYLTGRSTSTETLEKVKELVNDKTCMVVLDGDHRSSQVKRELVRYGKLVTKGQYMVAEDTYLNGHPIPWEHGPGPMEAVEWFLKRHKDFIRIPLEDQYLLSQHPGGWLRKL
jgi:cephalosporin hydroxylase